MRFANEERCRVETTIKSSLPISSAADMRSRVSGVASCLKMLSVLMSVWWEG